MQGRYAEARVLFQQSLAIKEKLGDERGRAATLAMLANITSEAAEQKKLYQQSLEIMQRIGDAYGVAAILRNMGQVAQGEGNRAEAARLFRESLEIFERLGMPQAEEVREWLAQVSTDAEHNRSA